MSLHKPPEVSLCSLLTVVALSSRPAGAQSDGDTPTIKEIMAKLHKGSKAPLTAVKAELKTDSPDWAKVKTEATIIENTVVVRSPEVPMPTAVRYGWTAFPVCNLYNAEGLPASPFRTDVADYLKQ